VLETEQEKTAARDFRITASHHIGEGGLRGKALTNIEAIRTLNQIETENRDATEAGKSILVRYAGLGAMPSAFRACVWRIADFPRISNSPHTGRQESAIVGKGYHTEEDVTGPVSPVSSARQNKCSAWRFPSARRSSPIRGCRFEGDSRQRCWRCCQGQAFPR